MSNNNKSGNKIVETNSFQKFVLGVFLAVMLGHIMIVGKDILLPIIISIIFVYILVSASERIGQLRYCHNLPKWLRQLLVLASLIFILYLLVTSTLATASKISDRLPVYQLNLTKFLSSNFDFLKVYMTDDINIFWSQLNSKIDFQAIISSILGSVGSLAGITVTVTIYTIFMLSDRGVLVKRIANAIPGMGSGEASRLMVEMNRSIGDYLAVKTLINCILASICFVVLFIFGVDYAIFWAVLIGIFNYVPYVGSLLGVIFPVMLALAQFGSIEIAIALAVILTIAQVVVGNFVEPRMIGEKVSISPIMILISLTIWSNIWGLAGAILAIPLTSIIAIFLSAFPATRPISTLITGAQFKVESAAEEND